MPEVSPKITSYLNTLYGENAAQKYLDFIKEEPTQYIRVNQLKTSRDALKKLLRENYSIETEDIPSIPFALKVLKGKEVISKTVEHINGLYYMQGLSSMIPPIVLNPAPGEVIMDLCSAPGSKTTELGELMKNKGTIVANEVALNRVKMLVYNIDRMNVLNTGVMHFKGEILSKIYNEHFDKILVDAPCSGLGIMQKKEEVSNWWSVEKAETLGDLQLRLLIAAVKMVKTGGEIVYSTCTLTPEENEFVINKMLKKYPVEIVDVDLPVPSLDGLTNYNHVNLNSTLSAARRILPWEADSDGFFIVKLRKTGPEESPDPGDFGRREIILYNHDHKDIRAKLKNLISDFGLSEDKLAEYKYILKGYDLFFVDKDWEDDNPGLFERIGTRFGTIDKNDKTVLHTQAAQTLEAFIQKNIFEIEDQKDLKAYLDGGIIKKHPDFKGQCVVKYNGHVLGSAVVTGAGIKSRFPRSKRTQEIIKEF